MKGLAFGTWPASGFRVFSKILLPKVGASVWTCLLFDQYQKPPAATAMIATIAIIKNLGLMAIGNLNLEKIENGDKLSIVTIY